MAALSRHGIEILRPVAGDASRPLVLHVIHRLSTGGLENGVVNLINHMAPSAYRHAVLALTDMTDFRGRVQRDDVGFYALHKRPGHGVRSYPGFVSLLRDLRPTVVHTRNLGPLEMQLAAAIAGVPRRVHGEHGREMSDLDGSNRRQQWVRRLYAPFVHRYIALSKDLENYLLTKVGVRRSKVVQIYNGVDAARFSPVAAGTDPGSISPFRHSSHWIVGTVGRMQAVKNQTLLVDAFVRAVGLAPAMADRARLMLVGDGPLRQTCRERLRAAGLEHLAWMPGECTDVPDIMRQMHCFALPSLAEGISNTILEAMATGLPVVATDVGGNRELVVDGASGVLVPSGDPDRMARALVQLFSDPNLSAEMGRRGRDEVDRRFSMQAMVMAYRQTYDGIDSATLTARH